MIYKSDSITSVCQAIYEKGYSVSTEGNVSMRGGEFLYITPSGLHKGVENFTTVKVRIGDGEWKQFNNQLPSPSSELSLHLALYKLRPEINAVIHAHPTYAVALTTISILLDERMEKGPADAIGKVKTVGRMPSDSSELYGLLGKHNLDVNAIVVSRHGTITLGETMQQAFNRLEMLEKAAKLLYLEYLASRK